MGRVAFSFQGYHHLDIAILSERSDHQCDALLDVWESSVRATHEFLGEDDIARLRPQVRQALSDASLILVGATDSDGCLWGFMGVSADKIEMLFLHPNLRGYGLGRRFVHFAIDNLRALFVDVNEQNVQGVGFYQHLGFAVIGRSPLDGQGYSFPILHMELLQ